MHRASMSRAYGGAIIVCLAGFALASCKQDKPSAVTIPATRLIVGVTTPKEASRKEWVFNTVMEVLLKAPRGSDIVVFDASTNDTLFTVSVEDKKSMDLDKVRLDVWQRDIVSLKNKLSQEVTTKPANLLNMPKSLRFAANLPRSRLETRVLLIGTPLYVEAGAPQVSMDDGLVPTIGHLCVDHQLSPFSVAVFGKNLVGYQFYILDTREVLHKGREHEQAIDDFWKSMIEQSGGVRVVHTQDKDSFLKRVWDNSPTQAVISKIDCAVEKADWAMYPRPAEKLPPWIHPTFNDLKPSVRAEPPVGYVKVAIVWQCQKCDFDIHARARSDTHFLYFNRAKTKEGVLYKDYVTDPKIPYGFEYVEFIDPVDLRQLEVLVNFYGGRAVPGEAKFTFRLWFEPVSRNAKPEVIERKLAFKALVGNRGQKPETWDSPYWVRINNVELLKR